MQRKRINIQGTVQGIGFRPFVYNLAQKHSLVGFVNNSSLGVTIEIEGSDEAISKFIDTLLHNPPALACYQKVDISEIPLLNESRFKIVISEATEGRRVGIPPDICVCDDCLRELNDPNDRRYRYPFINCTNCGPRFTITKDIPYDREKTSMAEFPMCKDCAAEYANPADRRFHAQPDACPICGPSLELIDSNGNKIPSADAITKTAELLKSGALFAIKGLGGFHLACDATSYEAVATLRSRKHRPTKAMAIMVLSIEEAEKYAYIDETEKQLLLSSARPIVILKKKPNSPIAENVAPEVNDIGIFLPYTPLHYLLLQDCCIPLIMTSANISDEPIQYDNDEAFENLRNIADYFLMHNREIVAPCDDSVLTTFNKKIYMIRRSRGYVPSPFKLETKFKKKILATGPELKATFGFAFDDNFVFGQHIGDLKNIEAYDRYINNIEHFKDLFLFAPEVVAYDKHPDYLTTQFAQEMEGVEKIAIQHHYAHILSCIAENNYYDDVIGIEFDGTGYGDDGNLWGGEFFIASPAHYERFAHFKYVPLPGGEQAIKNPWRLIIPYFLEIFGEEETLKNKLLLRCAHLPELQLIIMAIKRGINAPLSSSVGRIFDCVSALMGVKCIATYEGEAAIVLEALCDADELGEYPYEIINSEQSQEVNITPMLFEIYKDVNSKISIPKMSGKFHNTIAKIIVAISEKICDKTSIKTVALSGGVFQNKILLSKTYNELKNKNFKVLTHSEVPTNDGGIALGQAIAANARCV